MGVSIADLTVEEFEALIGRAVEQKLLELLGDPDEGLELRDEVVTRLQRSLEAEHSGQRGLPIHEVASQLGLEW
jgi:hypothetical protein